jgi:hypothetical protein
MSEAMETSREATNAGAFSNEEIQNLRQLLSQLDSSSTSIATSNFVKSGNAFLASLGPCSWVIDSGANRHITGSSENFLSYSLCLRKENVRIADGSFHPVAACTSNIQLSSVFHPVNLLSVSYLTKTLDCKIEFFPNHCVFQDLKLAKVISSGR